MFELSYNEATMEGINNRFWGRLPRSRRAFSLAEVIIVLGVVGIIISGILPLYLNVITADRSAAFYSIAYKLADSTMEEYRNTNFDNLADEHRDIAELPSGAIDTTVTNEIDGHNEADIKQVDLVVSWDFKRHQEVHLVTYVYRDGL